MEIDVGSGIFYSIVWLVIGCCILGPVHMYHQNKAPHIHYYIPDENKKAADDMWKKVYNEAENDNKSFPHDIATEAMQATYGVPFVVKDYKLETPEDYEIPELPEPIENEVNKKDGYTEF